MSSFLGWTDDLALFARVCGATPFRVRRYLYLLHSWRFLQALASSCLPLLFPMAKGLGSCFLFSGLLLVNDGCRISGVGVALLVRGWLVRKAVVGVGEWDAGGSDLLPFFHGRLRGPTHLCEDGGISSELSSIRPCFFILWMDLRRRRGTDSVASNRPPNGLVD
ncbi:hypothetical protein RchiOBHm_Chr1g0329941 [Rosa chinensis]|uniref:Uncharacterized protein n=1 Tax=Rosa chinensis TaxID=74649 RepID=A0A2P6SB50_ROSCH|nr:hypothetical protein RchiOBHm_Chr1g0329941 [Rosa chinensis]